MTDSLTPSPQIAAKFAALSDWRGATLAKLRVLILTADSEISESIKWIKPTNPGGVIAWERAGMICTGEVYKTYVKLTFAQGAVLDDAAGVFNAGFGGGTRRAIDVREGEMVDEAAFVTLIRQAVAFNLARPNRQRKA